MREEFVYYLWQHRLLPQQLVTTQGEYIEVVHPGTRNIDSGPDYFNARLRIGDTLWAGNVEIHVKTSDWARHGHSGDKAYDNVILHVVIQDDASPEGAPGHTLVIGNYVDHDLENKYEQLMASRGKVPCEPDTAQAGPLALEAMLSCTLVERLQSRYNEIERLLAETKLSWEEAFYLRMTRSYGLRVNADAMEMLARSLPLKILGRHRDSLVQLEALLFGQAGLLNQSFTETWPRQLQNEYSFLQKKYSLNPLDSSIWKFARLRPPSFPTLRIAQFASLIHYSQGLFSRLTSIGTVGDAVALLMVPASDYWKNHYRFELISPPHSSSPGNNSIWLILINTVVPFLFAWGRDRGDQNASDRAINLLSQVPAEENSQISFWKSLGIDVPSSFHSQALLELKKNYCDRRRCLECQIGHQLIRSKG
ncbi:MAG: DUF2851 domain-containing protein [Bacteroidetes bacterium HGW-Bacteroidetes-22]|nr:MAG: DUF2851 domain-containing protein [Bacteroidetes bacterium HGW-Bacteroidetes-22]